MRCLTSKIFTVLKIKIAVLRDMIPSSLVIGIKLSGKLASYIFRIGACFPL
jgi:hypothetical protein